MTPAQRMLAENNQTAKYWLIEKPETAYTEKNVMRYYPEAEKLVIHLPDYYSDKLRKMTPAKSGGLNLTALRENQDALEWLINILESYRT